ncbi:MULTISPECIES: hypothetical protein [unclassified Tolypothrix]|nr:MULTISPECIES: hypothetical protein [unclassified Tolypothrix]
MKNASGASLRTQNRTTAPKHLTPASKLISTCLPDCANYRSNNG